ncbi:tetratricopeptide repeat protein [Fodinicola acaciae]|uniref:tetratricopeptide repeat protein n=1 Tax=Fodinicola acaciae TaxID=2681555 RepID=UPI0013D47C43|nr:tetratricopeptide repeat protein [Fodinicola acaciae]
MTDRDRLDWANELYERAFFNGDSEALETGERDLDQVEADLAMARGRLMHARFFQDRKENPRELELFERAARLYRQLGDPAREADAVFWAGTVHQVIRKDTAASLPFFEKSRELAVKAGEDLVLSFAVRHLGFAALEAGELDEAESLLRQSLELRRKVGFERGIAPALLALAEHARHANRDEEAEKLFDEATESATACGATKILEIVKAVRNQEDV